MPDLFFEDFEADSPLPDAELTVSGEEAAGFDRMFRLPPAHVVHDRAPEAGTPVSEWFTAVLGMRLLVQAVLGHSACLGAPGVDEVQWTGPVRAGDRLRFTGRVTAVRASRSRPDMGLVTIRFSLVNQDGGCVMTQDNVLLMGRRTTDART